MPAPYYRLRIKSLKFISAVDRGAQGAISNVALIKRAPTGDEIEAVCKVASVNEKLGLVFGWALATSLDGGATPHIDLQNDAIIGGDELIKVAAEFMEASAASDTLHDENPDGRVLFAMPLFPEINAALGIKSDTHGLAIGMRPSPETFKRFLSKELNAFSIGGVGERELVKALRRKRRPGAKPYPLQPLGPRAVGKMAVLTSETAGHTHSIDLDAPLDEYRNCLSTSMQTADAASSPHAHAWIYDQESGVITIGPDSGHVHLVSVPVPPDVLAAVLEESTETSVPPAGVSVTIAARAPDGTDITNWLAGMPDDAERVRVARLNPAAPWAAEWITKGAEMDQQAEIAKQAAEAEVTVEKASAIVKSAIAKRDAAHAELEAYVAKVAGERRISHRAASNALIGARDHEWLRIARKASEGHDTVCLVPEELARPASEALATKRDAVMATMKATVEEFAFRHNVTPVQARKRLTEISPAYQGMQKQALEIEREHSATIVDAQRHVDKTMWNLAMQSIQERDAKQEARAATRRNERPSYRVFRDHVERFGKERGITNYSQALSKALREDETARSLYEMVSDDYDRSSMGQAS